MIRASAASPCSTVQLASDPPATPRVLDAQATAGSRATPDMWADAYLGPNPGGWGYALRGRVNESGYASICTPGWVRGLATMLERWGTITLSDAVEPAARIAEDGFAVDSRIAAYWQVAVPVSRHAPPARGSPGQRRGVAPLSAAGRAAPPDRRRHPEPRLCRDAPPSRPARCGRLLRRASSPAHGRRPRARRRLSHRGGPRGLSRTRPRGDSWARIAIGRS